MKFFTAVIEMFWWLTIFASPFLLGSGIGLIVYIKNQNLLWLSISLVSIGMITGVLFAEHIRRKYGCSRYMAKIRATPDIWPDESLEEIAARKKIGEKL